MTDEQQSTEELEEKGFTEALIPDPELGALEPIGDALEAGEEGEETPSDPEPGDAGSGSEEGEAEVVADAFIGELTKEQVLEKLLRVDTMRDDVHESVMSKVFGRFGEVDQKLQALQGREFRFDSDKLTKGKLHETDETIAAALAEDLKDAFSGQAFDYEAAKADLRKSVIESINPYVERRILDAAVPNAEEIAGTKEFEKWFFNDASQRVRDTFKAWDDGTNMDGVAMAHAFGEFAKFAEGKVAAAKAKEETLKRSVESKRPAPTRPARKPMSEEEAFAAAAKEFEQRL